MSVIERLLGRAGAHHGGNGLELVPMRKRDLRAGVMEIESQCYPRPWSHDVFAGELEQVRGGTRHYLVARRHGAIVGYGGLWFAAGEAHITNLAVEPRMRRQHIATRLMLALADETIARSCPAWTLEVRVSSTGAQDLYRRFGFEPAGVRTRYYENVEDAIVMWCHDIQDGAYRRRLDEIRQGVTDAG